MWIMLNRPGSRNAITPEDREDLTAAFRSASDDPQVRAVVLTGLGGSFCAGADLRGGRAKLDEDRQPGTIERLVVEGVQALVRAILDCPKPIIAAVDGPAAGLGMNLAMACDLILAAPSATFSQSFVKRGLVPDGGGTFMLTRLVGPGRAKELMFFGDTLDAWEAATVGLVNRTVMEGELYPTAQLWSQRLAAGATGAISATKRLVNLVGEVGRDESFREEAAAVEANSYLADSHEGIQAFLEKREPRFTGR